MTSKSLNWILLHDLVLDTTRSATPQVGYPTPDRRRPQVGSPSQIGRDPRSGPHPRTEGPQDPSKDRGSPGPFQGQRVPRTLPNWHSQIEPPHEVVVYSREQRYLKPRKAGNRAHGRPLGMPGWTSPCTSGPDRSWIPYGTYLWRVHRIPGYGGYLLSILVTSSPPHLLQRSTPP